MPSKPLPPAPQPQRPSPLHPRNRHQGRYDFPALIRRHPALAAFVTINPYGKKSIDFANPEAVKTLNRALLAEHYGIHHWDIPPGYLCPPIPGRADYLHGLADLLAAGNDGVIPRGASLQVLDIGVGANCIYPLIGHREYGWRFLGVDIDPTALASAEVIIRANPGLAGAIRLRRQTDPEHIFQGLLQADERFDLSLCNPPFHASPDEATRGSRRKWRNLGKLDPSRKLPLLNFGGQGAELHCPGGEAAFVGRMIAESAQFSGQVCWFSSLISKTANLPAAQAALKKAGAREVRVVPMAQGQKQSRFVAWTFLDLDARRRWREERWKAPRQEAARA